MKKQTKKLTSLIIVISVLSSIITISYASGAISLITKPNVVIKDNVVSSTPLNVNTQGEKPVLQDEKTTLQVENTENEDSISISNTDVKLLDKMEATENSERITMPKQNNRLMSRSSTELEIGTKKEITPEEIATKRAVKLQFLKEKYPVEYNFLLTQTQIDPNYHVNILEVYDYWKIEDFESYVNTYISEGFSGLEKYHKVRRTENE